MPIFIKSAWDLIWTIIQALAVLTVVMGGLLTMAAAYGFISEILLGALWLLIMNDYGFDLGMSVVMAFGVIALITLTAPLLAFLIYGIAFVIGIGLNN